MNKELDEKLVRKFPLLFADRHKSMQETCMCWGFEHDDGWYQIIHDAAEKMEPIIKKWVEENKPLPCMACSCEARHHYGWAGWSPGKCLNIKKMSRVHFYTPWNRLDKWYWKAWLKVKQAAYNCLNSTIKFFHHDLHACHCEKYDPAHPRASQVKEKFGTLRFYMSSYIPGIDEIVREAEEKSETTCEVCGKPGELCSTGSWLKTVCNEHRVITHPGGWENSYRPIAEVQAEQDAEDESETETEGT